MAVHIKWSNNLDSLPPHRMMLVALPGVGNVGKTAIEAVRELHPTEELARLYPLGMPPIAALDERGLLTPPHLTLHASTTTNGTVLLTLTGSAQPNEPSQQSQTARDIMHFFREHAVEDVLVLAGMLDEASRKETFLVASDPDVRFELEHLGVDVRRDEPTGGAYGVAALLASMGPLFGLNTSCVISTSVGASKDVFGAQRTLEHLNRWFELGMAVPEDRSSWLKERLNDLAPKPQHDMVGELTAQHDAFYM